MRLILSLLSAALLSGAGATTIRVLIASGGSVAVRVPILPSVPQGQPATSPAATGPASPQGWAAWTVGTAGAHLTLNGQDAGSDTLYLPPAPGSAVQIAGRNYRGGLLLRAGGGVVNAVNVLDLEDYLLGVVPAEMPSGWAAKGAGEALRSQAVIARTYAAQHINPGASWDLCATESCQVYGGVSRETPAGDDAVLSTRNQVVSYGGLAARTYFSSDSGGYTASSRETWGQDLPYLQARPDPASQGPNSRWALSLPLSQVSAVAARYGVRGQVQSVAVTSVSSSGRVQAIRLVSAGGSKTLEGAESGGFVRSLGAKSSRVTLSGLDPLILSGAGAGHGVGLSQWGAAGLAQQGWNYLQIMGFYYAGASISSILGADGGGTGAGGAELSAGVPLERAGEEWARRQPDSPAASLPGLFAAGLPPL